MSDIEINTYELDQPFLLVSYNTGIIFENQVGGAFNNQERLEGFILPLDFTLRELINGFIDCHYVCYGGSGEGSIVHDGTHKETCAKLIQKIFDEYYNKWIYPRLGCLHFGVANLKFDFDRIDKLQEAYWPVSFEINKVPLNGFIVKDNCD